MGAFLKLFLLALLFTTATTTASPQFHHWKLALQWPPTMGNSLYFPHPLNFTIHGLWHDERNGSPSICRHPRKHFNINLFDNALETRLLICWPDVKYGNNVLFWTNEWKKHGGCSESPRYNQVGYFKLGADLHDRYNILAALRAVNISSTNPVPLVTINHTIIAHTRKVPILTCVQYNGGQALKEVHLCFKKRSFRQNPRVMDCPPPPPQRNDLCSGQIYLV